MNERSATTLTRRASLLAAAITAPPALTGRLAAAKKNRSAKRLKKAKKACQQDLSTCAAQRATCADQVEDCESTLLAICASDDLECFEQRLCCPLLETCDATAFLDCLVILG